MKNSDKILELIDSFYSITYNDDGYYESPKLYKNTYSELKAKHIKLIDSLEKYWVDAYVIPPELGSRVFTIQDLTVIGKGKFVHDHYFTEHGFVSEPHYDDGYGYIKFYANFEEIDFDTEFVL